jgi:hypothetical protein
VQVAAAAIADIGSSSFAMRVLTQPPVQIRAQILS